MELLDLYKNILNHKKYIALSTLAGLLVAVGIFYLPTKYYTTGAFFVRRSIDNNSTFFTYEGYYAQQSAVSFTNTVAALIESEDIQKQALQNLGYSINEQTLHKYAKYIKVTKESPQLVTLTVKGNSSDEAYNLWSSLANVLLITSSKINAQGDNKLSVSMIAEQPVVKKAYKSLWINIPAGLIAGAFLGVFLVSFKEYVRK